MKKLIAMTMALAMALSMTACSGGNTTAPETTAPETTAAETAAAGTTAEGAGDYTLITDGVLMVGMEIGYPPMEYFDEDGVTPIGFDVEMSQEIADRLGLEIEIVDTAWDGIFSGLDSNKYDLVMSSCSITEERQTNYLMSKPYVQNAIELLVPADSDITGIDAISGRSVAVQAETTCDDYLRNNDTGCELMEYDKVINCFDELKTGRVDAVLVDSVVAAYYLGEDSDSYVVAWQSDEAEPLGITFKKGNDGLCAAVEAILDEMAADGTTTAIAEKYFGTDITQGLD